ncbi:MAG: DUF2057 family protein [Succinivibrio sp.]|nr:DUF2057 family protein [Succinivibrio sp.]
MNKFTRNILAPLVGVAALLCGTAWADTGFKVPVHYTVELVDGDDSGDSYSRFTRMITLTPGRHQVVLLFKDSFSGGQDSRMVQSANPVVIDIMDLRQDQVLSFRYNLPSSINAAEAFSREQKIELIDLNGKKPVGKDQAGYFVMTSENGFVLTRDYRQELASLGRLYAPKYVNGENRSLGMTAYGVPTIRATPSQGPRSAAPADYNLETPLTTYEQESVMSTSSTGATKGPSFNELLRLYNSADDATKLKFVKYIMSH